MSSHRAPFAAEELLRHRAWVRSLARTLVRDEATVDDLEQETWLVAVEQPPEHGEAATTWLARVVRSRAIDLFRRRGRRAAREAIAARAEAVPSAADTVAVADAHRRVVDAVMSLEEPFRTAVLLRYFDGLPPREIARRTGVPVETARSRVRRGVERLREDLAPPDARRGLGRTGLLLLLTAAGGIDDGRGASAGAGAGGTLAAALLTKTCAAAAVAALLVAGWLAVRGSHDEHDGAAAVAPPPDAAGTVASRSRTAARAASPSSHDPGTAVADAAAATQTEPTTRLRIRREDGSALDGATALLHDDAHVLRIAQLGADATFDAGAPAAGRRVVVSQAGWMPQSVSVPDGAGPHDIVLPSGATVSGRVLLRGERPGEPVPVSLWLSAPVVPARLLREPSEIRESYPNVQGVSLVTSADGTFRVGGLVEGASGSAMPDWGWVLRTERAAQFTVPGPELVLDCTRHPRITGRVVRRGSGAPLARAEVLLSETSDEGSSSMRVRTDADGRFVVYVAHRPPPPEFSMQIVEQDGIPSLAAVLRGPFDGDRDAGTLEADDPWSATRRVRALDDTGRPVVGAVVAAVGELEWLGDTAGADGIVRVPGVGATERFLVAAPGHAPAEFVRPATEAVADVVLQRAAALTIRTEGDLPVGAIVSVSGATPAFAEPRGPLAHVLSERLGATRATASVRDAEGTDASWFRIARTIALPCMQPGVTLRIEGFDAAGERIASATTTLSRAERGDVVLRMPVARTLRGVVRLPDGAPAAGASVLIRSPRADDATAFAGGWSVWAECSDDGTFAVAGLCGDDVTVVVSAPGSVAWARRSVNVAASCDVRLEAALRLRVRPVEAEGTIVRGVAVSAQYIDARRWDGLVPEIDVEEQDDGTWIADRLPPGEIEVTVAGRGKPVKVRVRAESGAVDVVVPAEESSR